MTDNNEKIFVQIASYRDPELLPTLRDCIKKADNPQNLTFAIAWQHSTSDEWDTLEEYVNDDRFKIIDIRAEDSLGACWARNLTQQKYDGEFYTLQVDSHHRFVRGWDTLCKKMISDLQNDEVEGSKKPILTAYLPSYDPSDDPRSRIKEIWQLNFDRFTPEGVIFMMPAVMEDWKERSLPVPTRFFSAHFVFTLGRWNVEVPYDNNLYFHGEEITLAVRSYTNGYDLFIPNKIVAWHEYTRKGRTKHWDDNKKWSELNEKSLRRVKNILNIDGYITDEDFGLYGLGKERSLTDYEKFSGIRFRDRAVQQYTLDNFEAPNPIYRNERTYEKSFIKRFRHCIDLWKGSVGDEDYDFWAIIFEDEKGNQVYRQDADRNEINQIKEASKDGEWYLVWRTIPDISTPPAKWVIWPYNSNGQWGTKIESEIKKI